MAAKNLITITLSLNSLFYIPDKSRVPQNGLEILIRRRNGFDVEVFHQCFEHIGS